VEPARRYPAMVGRAFLLDRTGDLQHWCSCVRSGGRVVLPVACRLLLTGSRFVLRWNLYIVLVWTVRLFDVGRGVPPGWCLRCFRARSGFLAVEFGDDE
jgi:hypothetical protein